MMTVAQLADALGCQLRAGDGGGSTVVLGRVAGVGTAGPDALLFAEDGATLGLALASSAGAVVSTEAVAAGVEHRQPLLLHRQPRLAFARAAQLLRGVDTGPTIDAQAAIAPTAVLGERVSIGAFAVVGANAVIGFGTTVGAGAVIGAGVSVGADCRIYPRVVLYPGVTLGERVVLHAGAVLGADGFGYVRDTVTGEYTQFPQQGTLVVEDDVEVGANATIDRGALEESRIGRGTKIDNLVHVAHNVVVGRNVVIASQTGISGSTRIGDGAVFGGQVGVGDHAEVGDGVVLGGQAGVLPHKSLQGAGLLFWGTPAKPVKTYLRELATLARLVRSQRRREAGSRETPGDEE